MPNEVNWPESVWKEINDGVVNEVAKVRIAQKVFPATVFDTNPTEVADDEIDFDDLSIREGRTKPFVEIFQEFPVTATQVAKEAQLKTTRTLAQMTAKAIALAEDIIIFQGTNGQLPANVETEGRDSADGGLLGAAEPADADDDDPTKVSEPIEVERVTGGEPGERAAVGTAGAEGAVAEEKSALGKRTRVETGKPEREGGRPASEMSDFDRLAREMDVLTLPRVGLRQGVIYGEKLFTAVALGIAKLTSKGQAPKFALFLPTRAYADTFAPPSPASLVTTADRIRPLVEGGFYGTGTLPDNRGLLVALGGNPTALYIGREAATEYVRQEGSRHRFRVVERAQFVARDPRAFVLLKLK